MATVLLLIPDVISTSLLHGFRNLIIQSHPIYRRRMLDRPKLNNQEQAHYYWQNFKDHSKIHRCLGANDSYTPSQNLTVES
jgi:hypothetical protein